MTTTRKNITQPADWWAAFEAAAQARGQSISQWVGAACLERLTKDQRRKLSERPAANRPKLKKRD